jgi:hypothetical protein
VSLGPKKWIPHSVLDVGVIEVVVDGLTSRLAIADITKAVHAFRIDPHALKEGDFELFEGIVRAWRVLGFAFVKTAEALATAPETFAEFRALFALGADMGSLQQILLSGLAREG